MTQSMKAAITALWGAWLAAAGIIRYIQAASNAALGFGLVTSVMALNGAMLLKKGKRAAAGVLLALTLVFVIGFFAKKAAGEGMDLRVGIILASSVLEIIGLQADK